MSTTVRPRPTIRRRTLRALPALVAVVALGACGVSSGEAAGGDDADAPTTEQTTTTDDPEGGAELTPEQEASVAELAELYQGYGFTEEQAQCVAEEMVGTLGEDGSLDDPMAAATDVFNACDITAADLGGVEDALGGGSLDDTMRNAMVTAFEQSGLSPEQAECAADVYLDEFGAGVDSLTDPAVVDRIFEACGVDPADLSGN